MIKFGLPTYPICPGMTVGDRDRYELEWLLDNGNFANERSGKEYRKIKKVNENYYMLVTYEDNGYNSREIRLWSAPTLTELVSGKEIYLAYWCWYEKPVTTFS